MSLYKRKDSPHWWVKLSCNGQRIQRSTGTTVKGKARELHDKLKAQLWEQVRLGVKPSHTWEEAVVRWVKENSHKRTLVTDQFHLRWLHDDLTGKPLTGITRDVVEKIIDRGNSEGAKHATINRRLEVLRAILRRSLHDWEWIDRMPKIRMFKEPSRRVRYLEKEEAQRLLDELPEHLRHMAHFSLCTGLRQANVKGLQWSQVDLERRLAWIHPDQAKARRAIPVPLVTEAVQLLLKLHGNHPVFVFTYKGQPVNQVGTKAWRAAVKRTGLTDFRWHDLRHTWASWHAQAGTPMQVLQELGGWETAEMVRRYAHFGAEHLTPFADRFSTKAELSKVGDGYAAATLEEVGQVAQV